MVMDLWTHVDLVLSSSLRTDCFADTSRGAVKGGKVRTILRAHDGRGPPEGET